jgi:hypothetical protein
MVECFNLPTAKPYLVTGIYYTRTNGVKDTGVVIPNIVLFEKNEVVESKVVGIIRKVQISTTYLLDRPSKNATLEIDGDIYDFKDPVKRKNPLYVDFWESEVKIKN